MSAHLLAASVVVALRSDQFEQDGMPGLLQVQHGIIVDEGAMGVIFRRVAHLRRDDIELTGSV